MGGGIKMKTVMGKDYQRFITNPTVKNALRIYESDFEIQDGNITHMVIFEHNPYKFIVKLKNIGESIVGEFDISDVTCDNYSQNFAAVLTKKNEMDNIQESIGLNQNSQIDRVNKILDNGNYEYIIDYTLEVDRSVVSDLETNLLNTKFGAYVEAVLNDNGLIKLLISGGGSPAKHYARLAEVFHIIEQIGYYIRVIESKGENQTLIAIA